VGTGAVTDDVILFDGVCAYCEGAVRVILDNEREPHFKFAPLQSPAGQRLLKEHGLSADWITSYVLISGGKAYVKSAATFRITPWLRFPWRAFGVFRIVPRAINDFFYDIIARNRYKWFGKHETCRLLTPELASRFLPNSQID
jgi:predicted DCC family thiol-disulfide oxidoreductase YuxK